MYKDDNITGGCNDSLLRMMIDGKGLSSPSCEDGGHTDGEGSCSVGRWGILGYPLASVYAPLQSFEDVYDTDKAFERGTVFAELDLPFEGNKRISKGGNCRG